ncbi:ExbD/TolR family protein [Marinobacter alexandrii]|uniref:ExbD/TolR family protein n=2 Tax=Marinobacter alexandrii TaxID=2570351 RepID=UPI001107E693|nr:biopolymer transporter ExbD [Marinobacter alexandrii]MCK2148357.1 biopolymer transporter ExbD [Marinobacter alexandrii]
MTDLVPPPFSSGKTLMERVEDALLPLINLVFLLLMFFIVAGQIADEPLPELPGAETAAQQQEPRADLSVTSNGDWKIAGQILTPESLIAALPPADPQQPLTIAAAESLAMAKLESLFRTLEDAGYTEILLLTEPAS